MTCQSASSAFHWWKFSWAASKFPAVISSGLFIGQSELEEWLIAEVLEEGLIYTLLVATVSGLIIRDTVTETGRD